MKYFGYVLITHGPRPRGSLQRCSAAKRQIENLKLFWERHNLQDRPYVFDYARKIEGLSALPNLKHALDVVNGKNGRLIIDDCRRIFAHCSKNLRVGLFKEMAEYGEHFADLRTGRQLANLSNVDRAILLNAMSPISFQLEPSSQKQRPLEERQRQTRKAAAVSRIIRTKNANAKARELADLKESLKKDNRSVSAKIVAEKANEQGMKTTRGEKWSANSVRRALKRIEGATK